MFDSAAPARDVAIIGMAGIFPGAPDVATFWRNIVNGVDAVGDPPDDWRADLFYDPESTAGDRVYCKRGGYLRDLAAFNPLEYGVMPSSIDGGEPDHFLALRVAHEALADAGYIGDGARILDGDRVEVILGRGVYINRAFTSLVQHSLVIDQTLRLLRQLHPEHSDDEMNRLREELKRSLPPFNAEIAPGLVPNILSGRIANRLDLKGPNFTIDAACASSLIAVERALQDLQTGRCDMALVGGVQCSTPAPIHMIFCQLNALSRRGTIRPFAADADGTVLGEGLGMMVLKRISDATRDGDRVYAVIRSVGSASDGRALGLLAPRPEGQELAMRRAYDGAGIDPASIGLIEAHGTGTAVGDQTEAETLARVFGRRDGGGPRCAMGSVKSMIGHLLPAAGIAGMIKAALALHHKVLPPTLHCEQSNPRLGLEETPLYMNSETRPWVHGLPTPRRAGVNAFGFGGINAHAILEEVVPEQSRAVAVSGLSWDSEVVILRAATRELLREACSRLCDFVAAQPVDLASVAFTVNCAGTGNYAGTENSADKGNSAGQAGGLALAIVASSIDDLRDKLATGMERLADPACQMINDVGGIYFAETGLAGSGKLAFLFPGEGSQYLRMLADLCLRLPVVRERFDLVDRAFAEHSRKLSPGQVIFPPLFPNDADTCEARERRLAAMDFAAEAMFAANQGLFALLTELGICPDAVVGHSGGEVSALLAGGLIRVQDDTQLVANIMAINELYERLLKDGLVPAGGAIAVNAVERDVVLAAVQDVGGNVHLAIDNCPHQVVVCGDEAPVAAVATRLQRAGALCLKLAFQRPYHTAAFEPYCARIAPFFDRLEVGSPRMRVYSAATARPFPDDPTAIRRLAARQTALPVRFRETVQAMYGDGVRIFVEVGPGGTLTSFVSDTLQGRPHLAIAANLPRTSGIRQLNVLLGRLAVHGVGMRLEPLYEPRAVKRLALGGLVVDGGARTKLVPLPMGLSYLHLTDHSPRVTAPREPVLAATPVEAPASVPALGSAVSGNGSADRAMQAWLASMDQFLTVQRDVMRSYLEGAGSSFENGPSGENERPEASEIHSAPAMEVAEHAIQENGGAALDLAATVLAVIGERTGYPISMLAPTLDLEADLGIDSIKRIEILAAVHRRTGSIGPERMEIATGLKTIQQILDFLRPEAEDEPVAAALSRSDHAGRPPGSSSSGRAAGSVKPPATSNGNAFSDGCAAADSPASPEDDAKCERSRQDEDGCAALPLIDKVERTRAGVLVAARAFDTRRDWFLNDHALGALVSARDPALTGLPLMPLTMTIELMAEAAASLVPGLTVVEVRDIRALNWLGFDRGQAGLRITAIRRGGPESAAEVQVTVRLARSESVAEAIDIAEGVVSLADRYPDAPDGTIKLRSPRPSKWRPDRLYKDHMFHGPNFRGIETIDSWARNGSCATLKVLSRSALFESRRDPRFLMDPVLLDAAAQLIGYWAAEHLPTGFNVFPYRVKSVRVFEPMLPEGDSVTCQAGIRLIGDAQIHADLEITASDGRMVARVEGWEDLRVDFPDAFFRMCISPRGVALSAPVALPRGLDDAGDLCCRELSLASVPSLEAHGAIWLRVLARLVLGRREFEIWEGLERPAAGRIEWLLGRCCAKDAVSLLSRTDGEAESLPADIEILPDENGRPVVDGYSLATSIAHTDGFAVALACRTPGVMVGIDVERIDARHDGFEDLAFTEWERALIVRSGGPSACREHALRLWCAKEAAAKALGLGLAAGPQSVAIETYDAGTGIAHLSISEDLAARLADVPVSALIAHTDRRNDHVMSFCVYRGNTDDTT